MRYLLVALVLSVALIVAWNPAIQQGATTPGASNPFVADVTIDFETANPTDCTSEPGVTTDTSGEANCAATPETGLEGSEAMEWTTTWSGGNHIRYQDLFTVVSTGVSRMRWRSRIGDTGPASGNQRVFLGYNVGGGSGFDVEHNSTLGVGVYAVECDDGTTDVGSTNVSEEVVYYNCVTYDHDLDIATLYITTSESAEEYTHCTGTVEAQCDGASTGVSMTGGRTYQPRADTVSQWDLIEFDLP